MKTIDEILFSKAERVPIQVATNTFEYSFKIHDIQEAMKEYAEEYARRCLDIAADEATIQVNLGTGHEYLKSFSNEDTCNLPHESFIHKDSIRSIQLPPHEE